MSNCSAILTFDEHMVVITCLLKEGHDGDHEHTDLSDGDEDRFEIRWRPAPATLTEAQCSQSQN